jgi:hypothetical protein
MATLSDSLFERPDTGPSLAGNTRATAHVLV